LSDDDRLAVAAQNRAIAFLPAVQHPRPLAGLERDKLGAAETLRPIRNERGMG
jgi:hypothetical protein